MGVYTGKASFVGLFYSDIVYTYSNLQVKLCFVGNGDRRIAGIGSLYRKALVVTMDNKIC